MKLSCCCSLLELPCKNGTFEKHNNNAELKQMLKRPEKIIWHCLLLISNAISVSQLRSHLMKHKKVSKLFLIVFNKIWKAKH